MYKAVDVAEFIVQQTNAQKRPINNLMLQKILYFTQAEFLVGKRYKCFSDPIEAWDSGPVVPAVFEKYKNFGTSNLFVKRQFKTFQIKNNDAVTISNVIDACFEFSPDELTEITKRQLPWKRAYRHGLTPKNEVSCKNIRDFFAN